ncbi:MAG: integrase core domain-containing protein, partial [Nitrospinota bacterium]|nr:integrase core domain-containing protein [Nitrospinota bacterium]
WDVMEVFSRATAVCARRFLDTLQARTPFPIRAIQVDGGSELWAVFEAACAEREILLFELPPRSPKLNGRVERANRTHTEEFYEVYELPWTVASLNVRLREWEQVYNHIRPHQRLDYLTPAQALETFKKNGPGVSYVLNPYTRLTVANPGSSNGCSGRTKKSRLKNRGRLPSRKVSNLQPGREENNEDALREGCPRLSGNTRAGNARVGRPGPGG